nr:uncharacterized protein LOC129385030 [Dermacentor andersoni]
MQSSKLQRLYRPVVCRTANDESSSGATITQQYGHHDCATNYAQHRRPPTGSYQYAARSHFIGGHRYKGIIARLRLLRAWRARRTRHTFVQPCAELRRQLNVKPRSCSRPFIIPSSGLTSRGGTFDNVDQGFFQSRGTKKSSAAILADSLGCGDDLAPRLSSWVNTTTVEVEMVISNQITSGGTTVSHECCGSELRTLVDGCPSDFSSPICSSS